MTAAELAELIRDDVARALSRLIPANRDEELRQAASDAFRVAYDDLIDQPSPAATAGYTAGFLASMDQAFAMTDPDGTDEQIDRIASVIGTAAANAAVLTSHPPGTPLTWITMEDDRVRDLHTPLHGETRAAGDPYMVGGVPMLYPGQPVGPPEGWINCRCTLSLAATASAPVAESAPSTASAADSPASATLVADCGCNQPELSSPPGEVLVARTFDTDKRKVMADKGTAMPDGSYPIANVEDLRNAIQAIGRAKDPAAVKRHIRKRARALDAEHLIPESWTAALLEPDVGQPLYRQEIQAAPGTRDGPGWLTHPRDTQRLRNYWVRGPGAAKVGWGSPGDLTRCAKHLRKYVGPFAWGTCQNLHKEALGYWNPESKGRRGDAVLEATADDDITPETLSLIDAAFAAAAELEETPMLLYPTEWFQDPGFDAPTPLTITSDGRVLGHLASWDTCHVGITGECVKPPRSNTGYAHFRTGEVETREGELVAVGQITMDTGHAGKEAGPADTVAHYDNTGTGVADVAAGEDDFGIWVAGAMRPGVSEAQMYVLKATGALSGDWRRIGGNLELVAALAVNVPGFPIPRVELAAAINGQPTSLVAAAVVTPDPNAEAADRIALAVVAKLDARDERARRAAALQAAARQLRVDRLVAAGR